MSKVSVVARGSGRSQNAALDLLAGAETTGLLNAALDPAGGTVLHWSLRDVDSRPGGRTTVSYTATVRWADGDRVETLAATSASPATGRPEGGLTVTDGDRHVQVWRFPFDPELPALPAVSFTSSIAELTRDLGMDASDVEVRVRSYRPRKRAVVEMRAGGRQVFLKVLRPGVVAKVDGHHRRLAAAGVSVPRSLGYSDEGLLVLDALPGMPMRTLFESGNGLPNPAGAARSVIEMLDSLPPSEPETARRTPWSDHAMHYASVVAAACPELATRVSTLGSQIATTLDVYRRDGDDDSDETTHGDFYDAQLVVSGQTISGLLDLDTVGPGRRVDDLACMLAHLSVLTSLPISGAGQARRTLAAWLPAFGRRVDPTELRVRTAGVVMSLATGPFRAQEPAWEKTTAHRVSLAQRWLLAARGGRLS